MLSGSSDLSRSSLRIRHEGEFYRRLLSKEAPLSAAVPSFRGWDGAASCAVPFLWESRPGKPKHPTSPDAALPPLTPPPSYKCSPRTGRAPGAATAAEKHYSLRAAALLGAVLPRLARWKPRMPPPAHGSTAPPLSSAACSCGRRGRGGLPGASPFSSTEHDNEEDSSDTGLQASAPCFRLPYSSSRGGCYRSVIRRKSFHLPWMQKNY